MLEVFWGPSATPGSEVLEKNIGAAIEPDDKRFGKFSRGDGGPPTADDRPRGLLVPRPTELGKTAHPSTQRQKSVPHEDSSFDEVRQPIKDCEATLERC
jgi:hypothetical protein